MATQSQIRNKAFRETLKAKRAWKPADGRRKTHQEPAWLKPTDIEHPLDDDILASLRRGQMKAEVLVDLFSVDLDPARGTFHFRWEDADIADMWESILQRSLEVLRFCEPENEMFGEELEWIASAQFEAVCHATGRDPQVVRCALPRILEQYGHVPAAGEGARLVRAFRRMADAMSFQLTPAEALCRFR